MTATGISPELAARLAKDHPGLLAQLEQVADTTCASGNQFSIDSKVLSALEQSQLNAMVREMEDQATSATRRGELARSCLRLRGLTWAAIAGNRATP